MNENEKIQTIKNDISKSWNCYYYKTLKQINSLINYWQKYKEYRLSQLREQEYDDFFDKITIVFSHETKKPMSLTEKELIVPASYTSQKIIQEAHKLYNNLLVEKYIQNIKTYNLKDLNKKLCYYDIPQSHIKAFEKAVAIEHFETGWNDLFRLSRDLDQPLDFDIK